MNICEYDLLVIGGGPGGYSSAIRGAQKGMKTVLVERDVMGGTCLNRGCLPTKTLLEDTLMIAALRSSQFLRGEMKISFKTIAQRKAMLVQGAVAGIINTVKANGVEILEGNARFMGPGAVEVDMKGVEPKRISAKKVIIATGAAIEYEQGIEVDHDHVLTTEDALRLVAPPRNVAVVGSGNRGVEFASIYNNLGIAVVLIEREKRILPKEHRWISQRYKKILAGRGIKVLTRTTVKAARAIGGQGTVLILESPKGEQEVKVDKVIMAISRTPSFQGLDLKSAGLSLNQGMLEYGAGMQTEVEGIYVLGDAAGRPYLAHKAIGQAIAAVDHMLGLELDGRPRFIPNCIYGDPEVGSVGITEYEAKKDNRKVRTGEFYFVRNGRAGSMGKEEGFILMVSDAETSAVLGVHIMGPRATELVSLGVMAIQQGVDVNHLKKTVLPHMTFSESFFEAAMAIDGEAIHSAPG
ncbi:MAG: dihydrolipoyl dehydrogenase [Deltaproteobacteria bacterium]|nr:dihydrolipoyl dehydrogenase [Deltaproteobacteria bacterium]